MKRKRIILSILALAVVAGSAYAAYCGINISYSNFNVEPGGSASVLPSLTLNNCAEIDDPRTYSKTSGPSWVTVNSFNGRVTASPPAGTSLDDYSVTVSVTWNCVCSTGGDSDSLTVTVC